MTTTVVLIHQHHIADVVGGLVLGLFCYRVFVYWPSKRAVTAA